MCMTRTTRKYRTRKPMKIFKIVGISFRGEYSGIGNGRSVQLDTGEVVIATGKISHQGYETDSDQYWYKGFHGFKTEKLALSFVNRIALMAFKDAFNAGHYAIREYNVPAGSEVWEGLEEDWWGKSYKVIAVEKLIKEAKHE